MFNQIPSSPSPFVVPPSSYYYSNNNNQSLVMENPPYLQDASDDVKQKHAYIASVLTRSKMTVPMLKSVLKSLNLGTTGLKQVLQERLMYYVTQVASRDLFSQRVNSMHFLIKNELNGKSGAPPPAPPSYSYYSPPVHTQTVAAKVKTLPAVSDLVVSLPPPLTFSDSPFYMIKEPLLPGMILSMSAEQRATRMEFKLPDYYLKTVEEEAEQRKHGTVYPKYAVRLFGQILQPEPSAKTTSCEFPIALQLKVNDKAVEANTRGMKNKRGTTVPPDVTDLIKPQRATQRLETYYSHCGEVRYGIWAYVVEAKAMTQVLNDIKTRHIPREKPLQIIRSFYSDEDLVVDNIPLKLRCPVSFSRMETPVRSVFCKHVQCFDGRSFLQMQHQALQWRCPVCDDPMSYASLAVDDFMSEILSQAPESVDNVSLLKDGSYIIPQDDSDGEASSPEPEWLKKRHPDPPVVVSLDSDDDDGNDQNGSAAAPVAAVTPVVPAAVAPSTPVSPPQTNGTSRTNGSARSSMSRSTAATSVTHTPLELPPSDSQYQHPLPVLPASQRDASSSPPTQSPQQHSNRPERSGSTHSTSSIPDPKRRRTLQDFALPNWTGGLLGDASAYPDVITNVDDSSSDSTSPPPNLPTVPKTYSSSSLHLNGNDDLGLPSWESGIFSSSHSKNTNKLTSASPDTAATSVSPNGNGTPLGRSNAVRRGPRPQKTVVEVVDLTLSD
ncbi:E3 SUMO-protein ligase pli1 [Yarrowia sp. C11]|nr:E3 SUMO-protein ligase pli1 [Yarrowia sp. C11]